MAPHRTPTEQPIKATQEEVGLDASEELHNEIIHIFQDFESRLRPYYFKLAAQQLGGSSEISDSFNSFSYSTHRGHSNIHSNMTEKCPRDRRANRARTDYLLQQAPKLHDDPIFREWSHYHHEETAPPTPSSGPPMSVGAARSQFTTNNFTETYTSDTPNLDSMTTEEFFASHGIDGQAPIYESTTALWWRFIGMDLGGNIVTTSYIPKSLMKAWHGLVSYTHKYDPAPSDDNKDNKSKKSLTQHVTFVATQAFDAICALAIVVNSIIMGMSVQYLATHPDKLSPPVTYQTLNYTLSGWFFLEVLLRLHFEGLGFFFLRHRLWNIFDLIVVLFDAINLVFEITSGGDPEDSPLSNVTALRMLRVARIVRVLRVIRVMRFFRELRMMVNSIFSSTRSLMWSMLLLAIVIFIFAVYITQTVTQHLRELRDDNRLEDQDLRNFYGTLWDTTFTLYQAMSGGLNWRDIVVPLMRIHWAYAFTISFFIFFSVFSVMNVITGIFVDTALHSAMHDRDQLIAEEISSENTRIGALRKLFMEADTEGSGTICLTQLDEQVKNRKVLMYLRALGLEISEAVTLFRLLDVNSIGHIPIDDFVCGCARLIGGAKSIDLQTLMFENKKMVQRWAVFMRHTDKQFDRISRVIQSILKECKESSRAAKETVRRRAHHSPFYYQEKSVITATTTGTLRTQSDLTPVNDHHSLKPQNVSEESI